MYAAFMWTFQFFIATLKYNFCCLYENHTKTLHKLAGLLHSIVFEPTLFLQEFETRQARKFYWEDTFNCSPTCVVHCVPSVVPQSASQTLLTPSSTTQPQQSTTEAQPIVASSRLRAVSTDAVDPAPLTSGADLLSNKVCYLLQQEHQSDFDHLQPTDFFAPS